MNLGPHKHTSSAGYVYFIIGGFDRVLGYSFLDILDEEGDSVYSNSDERNPFLFKNFSYFVDLAGNTLGLDISDVGKAADLFAASPDLKIEDYKKLLSENGLEKFSKNCRY